MDYLNFTGSWGRNLMYSLIPSKRNITLIIKLIY